MHADSSALIPASPHIQEKTDGFGLSFGGEKKASSAHTAAEFQGFLFWRHAGWFLRPGLLQHSESRIDFRLLFFGGLTNPTSSHTGVPSASAST